MADLEAPLRVYVCSGTTPRPNKTGEGRATRDDSLPYDDGLRVRGIFAVLPAEVLSVAVLTGVVCAPAWAASASDGDSPDANFAPIEPAPVVDYRPIGDRAEAPESRVDWNSTVRQAGLTLAFQHAFRIAVQPKTRAELGGPFFGDYARSLKGIRGWDDGDSDLVNYMAHPIMGATAGFIYTSNERGPAAEFEMSRRYWGSRLRATGFAAAYTAAFEAAPLSEASIGNVGMNPGTNGAVDFVMTPIGGLGVMVAEDALDKHVLRKIERSSDNRWLVGTLRCLLNPSRSAVQITKFRPPWRRDGRPLGR